MAKRVFEGFADISKVLAIPPWPIHETMSTAEPGTINSCKFSSAILTSMTMSLLAPLQRWNDKLTYVYTTRVNRML